MNRSSCRSLCESGSGSRRDVLVGLAQRSTAAAGHLLVEVDWSVHFCRTAWLTRPGAAAQPRRPASVSGEDRFSPERVQRGESLHQDLAARFGSPPSLAARLVGWRHYQRAGGMLFRAKAVAFCSSRHGDTSTTVGGMRSCRAAWSARHPVKVEVAGSNPVRTAGIPGEVSLGSQLGQVAQLV